MNPPPKLSISARVKWLMERDPTTIRDALAFKARFGNFPDGMSPKTFANCEIKLSKAAPR